MAGQGGPEFKLILVGDGAVGKTTFVHRLSTGAFIKNYIPTQGVEMHPLRFATNCGPLTFNVWDIAGQDKFKGIRDSYYVQAQCAVIMFDVESRTSYENVEAWHREIGRYCMKIPVVVVGNKVDAKNRQVKATDIHFFRKQGLQYYDLSTKTNHKCENPFLWLARRLANQPNLEFVRQFARAPTILIDQSLIAQHQKESAVAQNLAIKDDGDVAKDVVPTTPASGLCGVSNDAMPTTPGRGPPRVPSTPPKALGRRAASEHQHRSKSGTPASGSHGARTNTTPSKLDGKMYAPFEKGSSKTVPESDHHSALRDRAAIESKQRSKSMSALHGFRGGGGAGTH